MTLIIVDGPRGSGKTTITTQLVSNFDGKLDIELFKSQRPLDPILQMHQAIDTFQANPEKVFVCDRFSLTEWVMSMVLNRTEPKKLTRTILTIDRRLAEINAHYFVIIATVEELDRRLQERTDGRGWDVPQSTVWPMWSAAVGISEVAEFVLNNDPCQKASLMQELRHRVLFNEKSVSWQVKKVENLPTD